MTTPAPLPTHDIHALARALQDRINERWHTTLTEHADKLANAYACGGDMAYGTYLGLLLRPLNRELKHADLTLTPDLPGNMDRSREWGHSEDETDQERWMWSLAQHKNGEALGALVTIVYHDHTRFYLPRAPRLLAVNAASDNAVITALSQHSEDFRNAREFTVEVAEYLAQQRPSLP